MTAFFRKLLSPVVELRDREFGTALMMFTYSFLVMTSYTALKPVTRSQFIKDLGADNLPFVQFAFGLLVGFIMQGYSVIVGRLPRRWALPMTLGGLVVLLVGFWVWFETGSQWASTGFYFFGLILGILVISQFWTLANEVYDPRQAKRIFGFIGGGASLGGIAGSSLTLQAKTIGTTNLLLVSAALMTLCLALVIAIIVREKPIIKGSLTGGEDERVSSTEALRLLKNSKHLQVIALIIGFAAIGAAIVEQQLNMATEAAKGQGNTDSITAFLGTVQLYTSMIGFVIQVWLTSKIQRYLGIGFALLILPTSLGITGTIMLLNGALWAPALARVIDTSLRYTVDKTTREILFLPLPNELKQQSKPFIDVTVDRFSKGIGALLVLFLIKDQIFGFRIGLGLTWQQLSWASLAMIGLWVAATIRARREYRLIFRRSLDQQAVEPEGLRLNEADLSTIETLVEEQGHPSPRHVIYAIDMLESLNKRQLVSPLLLNHDEPAVRARALGTVEGASLELRKRWAPGVERLLKDDAPEVRAAAVRALATVRGEQAAGLMRPHLNDRDSRLVVTAAAVLASSSNPEDVAAAAAALERLASDVRTSTAGARRDVAQALGTIPNKEFHPLLVPLMYDSHREVATEAIRSAGKLGGGDYLFVPPLVALLRHRLLKSAARDVLVGYGEGVLDTLAYFLRDPDEDIWTRRHIPGTLARIPSQKTMNILADALSERDGFLRYKVVNAIGRLRQDHPELALPPEKIHPLLVQEANRYFTYLSFRYNLVHLDPAAPETLLGRALTEKLTRTVDRIYRLLGLIYPWKDIAAARWSLAQGEARTKASAAEYLDNLLDSTLRKRVMPVIEDLPIEEKVKRGNALLKTRVRDAEDSLAQLVHDEDQVVAAAAIHMVEQRSLWTLADDLEYALEHRDVKDWFVFEAASWALAARLMTPEQRAARWLEPLPAVEIADRLRKLPVFQLTSVDELFRIAGTGRQVRRESGRVLFEAGKRAPDLEFLLDGAVTRVVNGAPSDTIAAPAALGFEEVFENVPQRATIKASGIAICLSLLSDQFLSLLSENTDLAHGIFRQLLEMHGGGEWRRVLTGVVRPPEEGRFRDGLEPIEKVLLLEEMPVFTRASSEQLSALAGITREVKLTESELLFREGDTPAIYILLAGELSLEPVGGGKPIFATAGDCIGVYETLGGTDSTGWKGHVTRSGVALRVEREALFDLLADHIDLLQGLFSALQRRQEAVNRGQPTESLPAQV
jgi:AAA family ATP:ADP antiporter